MRKAVRSLKALFYSQGINLLEKKVWHLGLVTVRQWVLYSAAVRVLELRMTSHTHWLPCYTSKLCLFFSPTLWLFNFYSEFQGSLQSITAAHLTFTPFVSHLACYYIMLSRYQLQGTSAAILMVVYNVLSVLGIWLGSYNRTQRNYHMTGIIMDRYHGRASSTHVEANRW